MRLSDDEERDVNRAAQIEGLRPREFARVLVVGGSRARVAGVEVLEIDALREELAATRLRLEEAGAAVMEALDIAIAERERARQADDRQRARSQKRAAKRAATKKRGKRSSARRRAA